MRLSTDPPYVSHTERLRLALRRWDDPTADRPSPEPPRPSSAQADALLADLDWQPEPIPLDHWDSPLV